MFFAYPLVLFACSESFDETDKPEITYRGDTGTPDSGSSTGEPDSLSDTGDTQDTDAPLDTGTEPTDTGVPIDTDETDTNDTQETDTDETDTEEDTDTDEDTDTEDTDTGNPPPPPPPPPPSIGYNMCGVGKTEFRPAGSWSDPIEPTYLPMVDENDTLLSFEDSIDYYDCAPTTDETGNEIIYRFTASNPGTFRAKLSDGSGVDIDIHLLQNPQINNGVATGCIDRAHETLEVQNLAAGTYYVILDSWSGLNGAYRLSFEWDSDGVWNTVEVTDGITWERLTTSSLYGSQQTVNVLRVDPSLDVLEPRSHSGCQTITTVRSGQNAIAGINGSFFSSGCSSLGMVRYQGTTFDTNTMHNHNGGHSYQMRTIGWNTFGTPIYSWLDQFQDWTTPEHAIGGYPSLVENGTLTNEVYPGQTVWSTTDWTANPRTAIGSTSAGEFLLVTLDGRTSLGSGVTSNDMADLMLSLGAVDAIGLDGGGSTSMTIEDCWHNDVVNHPSDNHSNGHNTPRSVSDGVYIWD